MTFESKYINPKKKTLDIVPNQYGGLTVNVVDTISYKLMRLGESKDIIGTEIFFEGRLFYPVIHLQKGPQGFAVTLPDFLIEDQMFFYNLALEREEGELDLQTYFRAQGFSNWKQKIEELRTVGLKAVKIALHHFIEFCKKKERCGKFNG